MLGLFNEMSLLAEVPWNVDIYSKNVVRSSNDWASEVVLMRRPPGVWQLWCCVSVSAGSTALDDGLFIRIVHFLLAIVNGQIRGSVHSKRGMTSLKFSFLHSTNVSN